MENFNLIIHGITNMPNLTPTDKLVMIHLYTLKSMDIHRSHVEVSSKQIGYKRHGYQRILKRLLEMGYVKNAGRGYYALVETKVF